MTRHDSHDPDRMRCAMPDRRARLETLRGGLQALVALLELDAACPWTQHFESCLTRAETLARGSPTQDDLDALSGTVAHVFGGMGSFNDYAPFRNGRLVRGMESLDALGDAVHAAALDLRRAAP